MSMFCVSKADLARMAFVAFLLFGFHMDQATVDVGSVNIWRFTVAWTREGVYTRLA